jgi:hypothetical protein
MNHCRKVLLTAQLRHHGHDCEAGRVPVPESVREEIEELLRELHREEDIPAILRQSK